MNAVMTPFESYAAPAAAGLVAAVWQGGLLALGVWLFLRAVPRLSAAARSLIWTAVFLLIAVLHLTPIALPATAGGSAARLHVSSYWAAALGALWLMASVVRAAQLVWGVLHLRRLVREAVAVAVSAELVPLLKRGRRAVQLCTSDQVARPSVVGFFRPKILVPPALLEMLSEGELKQVIVHEMEHLRRHDDWRNLLQKVALVLFPLNPVMALVERRLCAERELACDDGVLQAGTGRKAYALCLAHLAEYGALRRGYALMLGAWERRSELVRRIERIVTTPAAAMQRGPAAAVTMLGVGIALVGGAALARAPQLVSFAPVASMSKTAPGAGIELARRGEVLDRNAVESAIGGSAVNVKAEMPQQKQAVSHRAVLKQRRAAKTSDAQRLGTRLAELRTPAPQTLSAADSGLLVMTAWQSEDAQASELVVIQQVRPVQPVRVVRAVYLVPTPAGWLVVNI